MRILAALSALVAVTLPGPARAAPDDDVVAAFVIMADTGPVARVATMSDSCPTLTVDGRTRPMTIRAPAATLPSRRTASAALDSKPASFPVTVCELTLPARARRARLGRRQLPLPPAIIRRIVVIGDTGCRLKASAGAYQACNDPASYPFARIASRAAAWKPDLVIHVGDYLYRENGCPAGDLGCAGSPWGYGWDSWRADLFEPASPLFAAAPWVLTRGNHESCNRAGQGWWRLLDPRALQPARDCIAETDDVEGDWSMPYAASLGGGAQVVVMDLSDADTKPIRPEDPRYAQFIRTHDELARLAKSARFTFATAHYPILGITKPEAKRGEPPRAGNAAIRSTFGQVDPALIPAGVDVLLAGHVHLWEHVAYDGAAPSQYVAGFSGTQEDAVSLPATLPADTAPVPGLAVRQFEAWSGGFGFMTMERKGPTTWSVAVRGVDGRIVRRCRIAGRSSRCGPETGRTHAAEDGSAPTRAPPTIRPQTGSGLTP